MYAGVVYTRNRLMPWVSPEVWSNTSSNKSPIQYSAEKRFTSWTSLDSCSILPSPLRIIRARRVIHETTSKAARPESRMSVRSLRQARHTVQGPRSCNSRHYSSAAKRLEILVRSDFDFSMALVHKALYLLI
jgi:hypothetical protein